MNKTAFLSSFFLSCAAFAHVAIDPPVAETGATWSGAVHRFAHDTVTRNFAESTETSRTHDGNSTAFDTTTYSDANVSRLFEEAASDSVRGVTWNLPRFSNPFPVSGSIVRNVQIHVVATRFDADEAPSMACIL